jgi:serine/threonine protein kinase
MPNLTTIDDAMRRPARMVPGIQRLGGGRIALAGPNQPWRVAGADAVVYQLQQPSGRNLALRCFLADHPEPGLAERYRGLASQPTIKKLRAAPGSPLVGDITYIADGLTLPAADLRSVHLPLVAMDWVDGPTLLNAVDDACRAGDRAYLEQLAGAWLDAVDLLDSTGFTHGDLTGDNLLVSPNGQIVLVDYDTAFWPGAARPSVTDATPGYRHPAGLPGPSHRDRYPGLVIFASLRALSQWPELREQFGDPAGTRNGALLFGAHDLANPDESKLFAALRSLVDPPTRALIGVLREASKMRPGEVPPLREAVSAAFNIAREARPRQPNDSRLDSRRRQELLTRLNGMLMGGDVDLALDFWHTSGLSRDPEASRDFGPRLAEIQERRLRSQEWTATSKPHPQPPPASAPLELDLTSERIDYPAASVSEPKRPRRAPTPEDVARLGRALASGDAATVGALWPEVRELPEASSYALQACAVVEKLHAAAIAGAIERGDDERTIAAVAEADRAGVAVGTFARRAARTAARRLETRRRLKVALAKDDRAALAELAISGRLTEMGKVDPQDRALITRAVEWPHLAHALDADNDEAILAAYDQEIFALSDSLSAEHRARIDLAHRRVTWLTAVRRAIRKRDVAGLRAAYNDIPPDVEQRLSRIERERVRRLLARDQAVRNLEAALREGSDKTILQALNALESVGGTLPDSIDWQAMRVVVDRVTVASGIRRALSANPPDYARLSRLLPTARGIVANDADAFGPDINLDQLEEALRRVAHRERLREALARGDEKAIVAAAVPDPYHVIGTLAPEEQARVRQAIGDR